MGRCVKCDPRYAAIHVQYRNRIGRGRINVFANRPEGVSTVHKDITERYDSR
jgi:hypothetical protein